MADTSAPAPFTHPCGGEWNGDPDELHQVPPLTKQTPTVGTQNSNTQATFAQMASRSLSKKDQRADYDIHRRETVARVYHAANTKPVYFSHHRSDITLAVKFDKEGYPNTEASKSIEKLFP